MIRDFKETALNYIGGEKIATFFSAEDKWIRRIKKFKEQYPDDVDIRYVNTDGSMVVHIPVSWFKITPKKTRKYTEDQLKDLRERGKKLSELKKNNK